MADASGVGGRKLNDATNALGGHGRECRANVPRPSEGVEAMITAADIDVTIPGEVASVDAAAQWLEGLRDDAEDASGLLNAAALTEISSGEVSAAVTSYALMLWQCSMDIYVRATDAADVTRAFADQLGWRKDDMKEHLETARGDGLTVKVIQGRVWGFRGSVC